MSKYSCEKCAKTFSQKSHYDKHISRKNPCEIQTDKIKALIDKAVDEKLIDLNIKLKLNTTESNITINITEEMDVYSKKTREELISICKEKSIKGYSGKKKDEIIKLLEDTSNTTTTTTVPVKNEFVIETTTKSNSQKLNMIDLFAGTGAFTLAFQLTNHVNVVFGNDMVEHSKKIYDENFNHKLTLKDLNDVKVEDIPSHDILTGGFPCQPFSIAGLQEGFKDERSNVFWKILSIIDYHQPKCVILENVKNLVSHDETKTFTTIKENLQKRGYYVSYKVLNTAEITGIPQHRERIYIVCVKSKKVFDKFSLDFPKIEKKPVSNFFETSVPDKYYYTDKSSTWTLVKNSVVKKNTIYQYRRVYVRENKSSECPTLTANMGGGGHNVPLILDDKGIRKLTPRECFNFQGFPSSYKLPNLSDSNLYKLAGNAVSVPVVKLIANRIIPLLKEE
jgi:DNA (cytosine-5)-methyltransferase 1